MTYAKAGKDWFQPSQAGFKLACCDCHLTHVVDFRIVRGRVQMRIARDNRITSNKRRHMPIVARKTVAEQRKAMRK